jgi:AbrB family looped-hinge helix DNA binding protein
MSYNKVRQKAEVMLKARVSSREQLTLPEEVRDQLGLGEGAYLTVINRNPEAVEKALMNKS